MNSNICIDIRTGNIFIRIISKILKYPSSSLILKLLNNRINGISFGKFLIIAFRTEILFPSISISITFNLKINLPSVHPKKDSER